MNEQQKRRADSPGAAKPPCSNWINTGTCKFGDRCKYEHDQAAKGKGAAPAADAKAQAKAKAKADPQK